MFSIVSYWAVPWGSLAEPDVLDGISSMVSYCLGLGGILAETGVVSVVDGISSMVSYCLGLGGTLVETCEVIVDISNGTR